MGIMYIGQLEWHLRIGSQQESPFQVEKIHITTCNYFTGIVMV